MQFKKDKEKYYLLGILLVGFSLRIFNFAKLPPGLYFDEVLYGLDAYSVLKTAKDIWSHFLPLAFQSSGYYPPVYTYTLVPFIALLGLKAWVIRLPALISAIFAILGLYLYTKEVTNKNKSTAPLIAAALLAVSPWHIHISRVAFLSGFGVSFLVFGLYFFQRATKKEYFLIFSAILFAISIHVHYGYVFLSPAIFLLLLVIYRHKLKIRSHVWLLVFLIWGFSLGGYLAAHHKYNAGLRVGQLYENNISKLAKSYFETYSFDFLFKRGEAYPLNNPWHRGQLQLSLLPFLLIGLWSLRFLGKKSALVILILLIFIPIPSAIATMGKHAVRNSPLLIPLLILCALGVEYTLTKGSKIKIKIFSFVLLLLFATETFQYLKFYTQSYSDRFWALWGNKQRQAVDFSLKNQDKYDQIIFVDNYNIMLSYFAFESAQSPQEVQETIQHPTNIYGNPAKQVGKFYFLTSEENRNVNWLNNLPKQSLVIDALSNQNNNQNQFRYWELK